VTFNNTINGAQSLTLNAGTGNIAINGIVGGLTPLTNLTVVNAGNVTFGNNVTTTGNLLQSAGTGTTTLNGATVGGNLTLTTGAITLATTPVSVTGGPIALTAANSVNQNANLTASGVNPITVTAIGGPITMAGVAATSSGSGSITYSAGTNVTLGSLATGGAIDVMANGGSVLRAAGSGTNVTAGANSTLQAFNGVVGTQAGPINVAINPGTLGIRATTAIGGISAFLTGTVLPGNALTLLNVPPGLVCFNICTVTSVPVSGLANSTFGYLNPETIIPAYYPQPSRSVLISDITSVYMPGTLLQPSPVSLSSGNPAVQSMGPKAKAGASCKQGETVPNQKEAAASLDVRCAVQ